MRHVTFAGALPPVGQVVQLLHFSHPSPWQVLDSLDYLQNWPAAIAGMAGLHSLLSWTFPLTAGDYLHGLRRLALPADVAGRSLDVLSAAGALQELELSWPGKQLESSHSVSQPALAALQWAARHPALQRLCTCLDNRPAPAALLDERHNGPESALSPPSSPSQQPVAVRLAARRPGHRHPAAHPLSEPVGVPELRQTQGRSGGATGVAWPAARASLPTTLPRRLISHRRFHPTFPASCRRSLRRVCRRWRDLIDSPPLLACVSVQLEAHDPRDAADSEEQSGSEGYDWDDWEAWGDMDRPIQHILDFCLWLERRAAPHVERLGVGLGQLALRFDRELESAESAALALCRALRACTKLQARAACGAAATAQPCVLQMQLQLSFCLCQLDCCCCCRCRRAQRAAAAATAVAQSHPLPIHLPLPYCAAPVAGHAVLAAAMHQRGAGARCPGAAALPEHHVSGRQRRVSACHPANCQPAGAYGAREAAPGRHPSGAGRAASARHLGPATAAAGPAAGRRPAAQPDIVCA